MGLRRLGIGITSTISILRLNTLSNNDFNATIPLLTNPESKLFNNFIFKEASDITLVISFSVQEEKYVQKNRVKKRY